MTSADVFGPWLEKITHDYGEITEEQAVAEPSAPDLSSVAEQLVAAARSQGVELTGPGGLPTGLARQVLETALDVEMSDHLGYDRHGRSGGRQERPQRQHGARRSAPTSRGTDRGAAGPGRHVRRGRGRQACPTAHRPVADLQ